MKAHEIQPGDELRDEDGKLVYTVLSVDSDTRQGVHPLVRYAADGGSDFRHFFADQDVPLVRP